MGDGTRVHDLAGIEVEHLLDAGSHHGRVKIRAVSDTAIVLGTITPAGARRIAGHLFECASRAEYEEDLASEALVRWSGEPRDVRRHNALPRPDH